MYAIVNKGDVRGIKDTVIKLRNEILNDRQRIEHVNRNNVKIEKLSNSHAISEYMKLYTD